MTKTGVSGPYWLDPHDKTGFPDVREALTEPDGLLAIGGDLSSERLMAAYRCGIFPWYSDGQPILWWSPNPRAVLYLDALHISRSLKKTLRRQEYTVTFDRAYAEVIRACAQPRKDGLGTWITSEMASAYIRLHRQGYAHSIELWRGQQLVGGLYGVSLGRIFFGESMFSHVPSASKIVFVYLVRQLQHWQFALLDCQIYSPHLGTLGARLIPREKFIQYLDIYCEQAGRPGRWEYELDRSTILQGL